MAPDKTADRYLWGTKIELQLDGAPFTAMVHIGLIDGRAVCIGLDIHGFDETAVDGSGAVKIKPLPSWRPLTARRLREVRVDALSEEARAEIHSVIEEALDYPGAKWTDPAVADAHQTLSLLDGRMSEPRPGRPPTVSDAQIVEVVVPAYERHREHGGRSPVQAVREALEAAGAVEGSGPNREVTMGQARAIVRRARRLQLLDRHQVSEKGKGKEA